jgi:predicted nucleotidyltransferase
MYTHVTSLSKYIEKERDQIKRVELEAEAENTNNIFISPSTCRADSHNREDRLLCPVAGVVELNTENTASTSNLVHFS